MSTKAQVHSQTMWGQPPSVVPTEGRERTGNPLPATDKAGRERRRALILPREHGAWGLLLVPMVTGAGVAFHQASHIFPLILLLTAALALFWLRTPLESLLGTSAMRAQTLEEAHTLRSIIVLLAGIAAVTLATTPQCDIGLHEAANIGLGEKDQAFEWLEKSYEQRSWHLGLLKSQPIFKSLRSDPRFADLQRRMKLPQ